MVYGFAVTRQGLDLIMKLLIPEQLVLTRVMVGSGRAPDGADIANFTDLIQPVAQATSTVPVVANHLLQFIVEYRNEFSPGLPGFNINEYGVFAQDPDIGEIMIYYGSLGDYPEWVHPFSPGELNVRRYPVSIGLTNDVTVIAAYPQVAFMTAEDVTALMQTHINQTVYSSNGVHGIRFYQGVLEIYNGEAWFPVTRQDNGATFGAAFFGTANFGAA